MSEHVTQEQAVMLKEQGYDVPCREYWYGEEMLQDQYPLNQNEHDGCISAPSLSEAADWLRDVKGLHYYCYPTPKWGYWISAIHNKEKEGWHKVGDYDTHSLALSAAITKALTILKERTPN